MFSTRRVLLLAMLLLVAVPATVVQAQEATTISEAPIGTAVIWDDQALSDAITYALTSVPAPAADTAYEGWLVSDDGSVKLSTGVITVASDGSANHTFDSNSTGYTGENLIAGFDKVLITVEPVPDDNAGPSDVVAYSHQIPTGAMTHIRHLLVTWSPPDATKGILTNLKEQIDVAIVQANLATNSTTLTDIQTYTHQVINILEGTEGANYDTSFSDPGDGVGVINHAADRKHALFAATAVPDDDVVVANAALVDIAGKNALDWATLARDTAVDKVLTADITLAKIFLGPGGNTVISLLEAARNGLDANGDDTIASIAGEGGAQQAYVDTQRMATYTLVAGGTTTNSEGATSEPEPEPELPATGDQTIPRLAQLALLTGLVLLAGGSALLIRSRHSRIRV